MFQRNANRSNRIGATAGFHFHKNSLLCVLTPFLCAYVKFLVYAKKPALIVDLEDMNSHESELRGDGKQIYT